MSRKPTDSNRRKCIALVAHDHRKAADVKALLRIAVVWNIPVACNRASADYMISSPLMREAHERRMPDFGPDWVKERSSFF